MTIVLATDFYEHSSISTKYAKFKQKKLVWMNAKVPESFC